MDNQQKKLELQWNQKKMKIVVIRKRMISEYGFIRV